MNPELRDISSLLNTTSGFISQNEEIKKLRGENFNLFSILKMETAENNTHSNFIAELLNISGSHQNGSVFLHLFLNKFCPDHLDIASTKVKVEHSIGRINLERSIGGRIDIYLCDKNNNTINIENKIYAVDQDKQIVRYCNYNKPKNKVFYLSLFGDNPSDYSRGILNSPEDFVNISYENDILDWLSECIKESADQPILRESIKQYTVLIKKLTKTMDHQFEKDIKKLIINNLESARYIRDKANHYIHETKDNFRKAVFNSLKLKLKEDGFKVTIGYKIKERHAQIWVEPNGQIGCPFLFGIETFSGSRGAHLNGALFIGVFNTKPSIFKIDSKSFNHLTDNWLHYSELKLHNEPISLWEQDFLIQIIDSSTSIFTNIVESISNQCVDFINENSEWVIEENKKATL